VRCQDFNVRHAPEHLAKGIPCGECNFGFWPRSQSVYIRSKVTSDASIYSKHLRKALDEQSNPIVDKTWFFSETGQLQEWLRGRRIADSKTAAVSRYISPIVNDSL
jgi:hypothetical protein